MTRTMFKSKIHRAVVTEADLYYEGSLSVDRDLMEKADMREYEMVHVVNINNGQRLVTYLIEAPAGSGTICLNGAAARLGHKGDKIIIITYADMTDEEIETYQPTVVLVDENNRPVE